MTPMSTSAPPRSLLAAVLVAGAGLLATATALGAASPGPRLTIDRTAVQPGAAVHLTGSGFPHTAHLVLLAGAREHGAKPIGSAVTGARGGFVATVRVRRRASPGSFVVVACSDACHLRASTRFRIVRR